MIKATRLPMSGSRHLEIIPPASGIVDTADGLGVLWVLVCNLAVAGAGMVFIVQGQTPRAWLWRGETIS